MTQFILVLAVALTALTAGGTATKQVSHHPVIVAPADANPVGPV
jgi:hypothetical protein